MRIDGPNPVPPAVAQPVVREAKATPCLRQRLPWSKIMWKTQPTPAVNPTNVLVEMQPGNIVVYKFVDQASGRLIEQIPSEQMLNLSRPSNPRKEKK